MPSLIIHLAIAKRYTEIHPNKISNLTDFEKGSIAPDFNNDFSKILSKPEKAITHYYFESKKNNATDFNMFKHDKKVDLANDYWKGYYAHILADHLFYTSYFKQEDAQSIKDNTDLYDDFTKLTPRIIEDYQLKLDGDVITV